MTKRVSLNSIYNIAKHLMFGLVFTNIQNIKCGDDTDRFCKSLSTAAQCGRVVEFAQMSEYDQRIYTKMSSRIGFSKYSKEACKSSFLGLKRETTDSGLNEENVCKTLRFLIDEVKVDSRFALKDGEKRKQFESSSSEPEDVSDLAADELLRKYQESEPHERSDMKKRYLIYKYLEAYKLHIRKNRDFRDSDHKDLTTIFRNMDLSIQRHMTSLSVCAKEANEKQTLLTLEKMNTSVQERLNKFLRNYFTESLEAFKENIEKNKNIGSELKLLDERYKVDLENIEYIESTKQVIKNLEIQINTSEHRKTYAILKANFLTFRKSLEKLPTLKDKLEFNSEMDLESIIDLKKELSSKIELNLLDYSAKLSEMYTHKWTAQIFLKGLESKEKKDEYTLDLFKDWEEKFWNMINSKQSEKNEDSRSNKRTSTYKNNTLLNMFQNSNEPSSSSTEESPKSKPLVKLSLKAENEAILKSYKSLKEANVKLETTNKILDIYFMLHSRNDSEDASDGKEMTTSLEQKTYSSSDIKSESMPKASTDEAKITIEDLLNELDLLDIKFEGKKYVQNYAALAANYAKVYP
ncbi:hypothetical protein [Candidatus Nesciobacter abundans]|uniref:Uncharacterized protein n=1 Tax=Candidatus Nesciobacter abundans TaxID=2601668 RepID=A0A5C0UIA2_9PROT|nr:hypothetical protein [Candidatus Nesciobacter abundans]QEK39243.1 hypothetical protein FZC36_02300 [Candidatus Nesciobacter abundans]